jgi:hypothetical protein
MNFLNYPSQKLLFKNSFINRLKNFKNFYQNFKMYSEKRDSNREYSNESIPYINAEKSRLIDEELMGNDIGYSIDQLMEIAGLSVALSIHDVVKNNSEWKNVKKILNISGPGSKNLMKFLLFKKK